MPPPGTTAIRLAPWISFKVEDAILVVAQRANNAELVAQVHAHGHVRELWEGKFGNMFGPDCRLEASYIRMLIGIINVPTGHWYSVGNSGCTCAPLFGQHFQCLLLLLRAVSAEVSNLHTSSARALAARPRPWMRLNAARYR